MYKQVASCRICGNKNLVSILNLGNQFLTGVFPKNNQEVLTCGPLELVKCVPKSKNEVCGLVQLNHSYNLSEMYGNTYGYRSGLNQSMVKHLQGKVRSISQTVVLNKGDIVIDIGSNDCTLLNAYSEKGLIFYGVDPSAEKFRHFYPEDKMLITEFFPSETLLKILNGKKAKVITSIAMFYDLEEPQKFVKAVHDTLHPDGIWVFEQSYMPDMLKTNSYDTICHEHLEYYCFRQIIWMLNLAGLTIIKVELNDVNGGSFSITAARKDSGSFKENTQVIRQFKESENKDKYNSIEIYDTFKVKVEKHKNDLNKLLTSLKNEGKKVIGYGASTKGNVLLQYCGITSDLLPFIAEVNEDKFGAFTPGTLIPIISEKEAREMKPDYFFVLPWHFKENILKRETDFIKNGGSMLFPLPEIVIVNNKNHVYT